MKKMFLSIVSLIGGFLDALLMGPPTQRVKFADANPAMSFGYQMPIGFPGSVTRSHPASILPRMQDATNPPAVFGGPVMITATSTVRAVIAGDGSATPLRCYGFLVRSYPTQQQTGAMSSVFGQGVPPTAPQACDVLRQGFIMAKLPPGTVVKVDDPVFAWAAANSGAHVQGQVEGAASSTSTISITNARFASVADAAGNVEIEVWPL